MCVIENNCMHSIIDQQECMVTKFHTWSQGYKTFFVLNSIEHEILNAHKYKNIKKFGFFRFR